MLKVINTKMHSAQENMQIDVGLLDTLSTPTLHLYDWEKPSVTYGCFVHPEEFFSMEKVQNSQLDLAKRPTGGGIVFHMWDYAFSFLLPSSYPFYPQNVLEGYRFVHEIVLKALVEFLSSKKTFQEKSFDYAPDFLQNKEFFQFCMATPSKYDLLLDSKKVAGAAQRRTKKGFLHQGSIFLVAPDPLLLEKILLDGKNIWQAIVKNSFFPIEEKNLVSARKELSLLLVKNFHEKFD